LHVGMESRGMESTGLGRHGRQRIGIGNGPVVSDRAVSFGKSHGLPKRTPIEYSAPHAKHDLMEKQGSWKRRGAMQNGKSK